MSAVWTDENKFRKWLIVELAVLNHRERRGELPPGTTQGITEVTFVDAKIAEAINLREKEIGHDLNAFVEIMRCLLINGGGRFDNGRIEEILAQGHPEKWDHYFHEGMTSYDTEEPAMALLFHQADKIIEEDLDRVDHALCELAKKYRGTLMIGRTHGQYAQPVTFGKRCLDWLGPLRAAREAQELTSERIAVMKLSGAVGMYGTFGPEIEEAVAEDLGFGVTEIATQIVPLGFKAAHLSSLSLLACEIEKIAHDLWLLNQSEIGEVCEPFGKKQKGSSAMPHKKNPITLEKLFGLPRLMSGYADALQRNIATAHERDISHSSVERIAVPDAYGLLDHMLRQLARVLEGLQVFPERMQQNLEATKEVYASQAVRDLLGKHGVAGETAYRFVQKCANLVREKGVTLSDAFLTADDAEVSFDLRREIGRSEEFEQVFDPRRWVRHEDTFYKRLGL